MKKEIKETCCCGAMLEYSEEVQELYEEECAYRQKDFQETHLICRLKIKTGNLLQI